MPNLFRVPASENLYFKGREGDVRLGEWVQRINELDKLDGPQPIVLVGYPDDTGVGLNGGRRGASGGPDSIRKYLYKMTLPMDTEWEKRITLFDFGNVVPANAILDTHARVWALTAAMASRGAIVIALGGGHDFTGPSFLGFASGTDTDRWGLVNIDPHLDVRPYENGNPHSGTSFRQILESGTVPGPQFTEWGCRANRNARAHYQYVKDKHVRLKTLETLRAERNPLEVLFSKELSHLARKAKALGVSFDLDSCCEADGVSAPAVLGFTSWELCRMAHQAGRRPDVRYLDLMETAPALDTAERSSRLAAEMIFAFLSGRAVSPPRRARISSRSRNR